MTHNTFKKVLVTLKVKTHSSVYLTLRKPSSTSTCTRQPPGLCVCCQFISLKLIALSRISKVQLINANWTICSLVKLRGCGVRYQIEIY